MTPKQILVVDDWPEILHLLQIQLSHLGWDPVLAESGREALEKLKGVEPWLILLDIRMPDMDGLQ
ncbi:MAG: response regulator, partial [Candidatus Binatia bacterium]